MSGVRFAPSPTGAFHVGNFRTAWISRLIARELGLPWVVRFEDIDTPRVVPGAMERQTREMAELGLVADETVIQSSRAERHWAVFAEAVRSGQVYPCFCSRKDVREQLAGAASAPHGQVALYNGRCRALFDEGREFPRTELPTLAWRFRMQEASGAADFVIGRTKPGIRRRALPEKTGFVPAYHWACAIDDADGGYELLVRAWDLASVIEQQRAVARFVLGPETSARAPAGVFHCALVTHDDGSRLEKRTQGVTLPELEAAGISAVALARSFERSFRFPGKAAFHPGRVFGEDRQSLSLSELGLPLGGARA